MYLMLLVFTVLSPCERLREKNEAASEKFGKGTFIPKCDATGTWEPVQCMSHIGKKWQKNEMNCIYLFI